MFETLVVHLSHHKTLMKYETRFAYPPVIQTDKQKVCLKGALKTIEIYISPIVEERKRELFRDELQPLTWIPFVYGYRQTVANTDTDFGSEANLTVLIFRF